ncbi:MAG: EAL domain-containing protein [Burkholderiaceae bacterium]|nr:EAL domain-containing protein [Burkholderiaceae bacterium]
MTPNVSRLRIGPRLSLGFGLLLGLLLLLAGLSVSRLNELSGAFTRLVAEQNETHEILSDIGANAEDAARKLLVLISVKREQRVLAYAEIDAANRHLDAAVRLMDQRLPVGDRRQALFNVRQRLERYRQQYGSTVDLIEAEQRDDALQMLGTQTEETLTLLMEAIANLASQEQLASIKQADQLRASIARDRNTVAVLCLAAIAVGGLMALFVTRSIVRPLLRAQVGADRYAQGQYDHRIEVLGNDEVAQVSLAMNTMAEAVGDRERRLVLMAHTDLLTGLPERDRFIADGNTLLAGLAPARPMAVQLCLDVDRLKTVNSVLGFDAGDAVLVGAAGKLTSLFDGSACFGRLAGGTFAALVPIRDLAEAEQAAALIQDAVEHKLSWQGQTLDLSVSVGMALFPEHERQTEALLRRAEQAMFEAKRQRQQVALYNPKLEASRLLHLSLLSDLQDAIKLGQLRQFLQPKVCVADGQLRGVEALVRWEHPTRGWLPPSEFIPFAEDTGRIRQVTQWMLECAVATLADWQRQGLALPIAVNVSTLDLQDHGLPERIAALLDEARVPAHLLQLELTETGLMASGPDPIKVLHSLHRLGVVLAIDDFGTGQSSLAYLQRLPVHELKIDRSFVDGVNNDPRRQELLASIVKLGHSLGMLVTGEGVENAAELRVLREVRCDLVQGYMLAKPMDLSAFERWRESYVPDVVTGA